MIDRTVDMIRNGPGAATGLPTAIVGFWLWWRTWALVWMLLGGMVVAGASYRYLGPGWFFPYIAGIVIGGWIIRVSPKYSVEKNY